MLRGYRKSIEFFQEEKYRELEFGTIFYVAGKTTPDLNKAAKRNARKFSRIINSDVDYWVNCSIVYLDNDNDFFEQRDEATFYSPIIPTVDGQNSGYAFLVATLENCEEDVLLAAFDKYFATLLKIFDEILDEGRFREFPHLIDEDLTQTDMVCIHLAEGQKPISGLPPYKRLQTSRRVGLSKLRIDPTSYRVKLIDYGREIHFGPQVKALYILFLNHPEGIFMRDIRDYMREYTDLYFLLTNRSNNDKIRNSVEKLFDRWNSKALNVKKSQCHDALLDAIPDDEVRCYYEIEARRGRQHRIRLNRELVSIPESLRSKK